MIILNKTAYIGIILITGAAQVIFTPQSIITGSPLHDWFLTSINGEKGRRLISALQSLQMNWMEMKNPTLIENTTAWFSVNFLLLSCLHIPSEWVTLDTQTATGIDWWKNKHWLTAGNDNNSWSILWAFSSLAANATAACVTKPAFVVFILGRDLKPSSSTHSCLGS